MKEEWRDIEGFEGLYQVSNMGRVKSLERTTRIGRGCRIIPERILKPQKNMWGYLQVTLSKDGKIKHCMIHRLVAMAFIPNSNNLPEVNHIDEDKTNNRVENLEYCSRSYNINYGTRNKKVAEKVAEKLKGKKHSEEHNKKIAKKLSKPVFSVDKESGLIMFWESAIEAGRCIGISSSHISECCKGKLKSTGGFYWFYADDNE